MKGIKKISMTTLDRQWSRLVRERDGRCLYCGSTSNLNAHHVFGRARNGTRLLLENGVTLCAKCHVFSNEFSAHKTPEKFKRWAKKYLGRMYGKLEKISLAYYSRAEAIQNFKTLLEQL